MGYETKFDLDISSHTFKKEVKGLDANGNPASVFISEHLDYGSIKKEISNAAGYTYLWSNPVKWYEHEKEMREFSKKYPEVVFTLHGEGEESGDLWIKYFKNGKMQTSKARIEYDSYDESLLS
jgi:hypothetical protein